MDGRVWPYIVGSSVFELAYWALLAAAYGRNELSVVYPVARGVAPVLVLVFGIVVLGAATSARQAAGVVLVGAGVLAVRGARGTAVARGVLTGLAIAGTIAGYTLIDKQGLRYASPLTYLELAMVIPAIGYAGGIAAIRGPAVLRSGFTRVAVVAGFGQFGAYALVLAALRRAPAAPVAAVRETSVVVAVALAWLFLKERAGPVRLAGAVLVAGGVALVSL